eukprot:m.31033 g.31033  ORF g.31033 m.31033 type:complete len:53 (-) comp13935_c0_seq1:30-188(-)
MSTKKPELWMTWDHNRETLLKVGRCELKHVFAARNSERRVMNDVPVMLQAKQ